MKRVIKVGGRPQTDPLLTRALATVHRQAPGTLIVVHGGGDEVSALQRLHGIDSQFLNGRRVTTQIDLEIIRMALSGSANKRLVSALIGAGVPALGLSGEDGSLLTANPVDQAQYGFVGTPTDVNNGLLDLLMSAGYLPVVSPVSRSSDAAVSAVLNVNGDDAAARIAIAIGADELILVSDVEGVRVNGVTTRTLSHDDARRLIDDGTAHGGMHAKLQAALSALDGGVRRVRISDIAAIECLDRGTLLTQVGSMCA